jgi:hypothetical protein
VEEAFDRMEYFQHTRQNCPPKPIACPVEMRSRESSPNRNSREDLGELLEMMHHMEADLRDIKQSHVPSLAPKPRDIAPERTPLTYILCVEIGHSRGNCPNAFQPEVQEHSLESNQCFLNHCEVSMAYISQACTNYERSSRQQESSSMPWRRAVRTLSPGGAEQVTCTVQDGVRKRSRSLPGIQRKCNRVHSEV